MDKTRRDSYTLTTIIAVTIIFMGEGYFPSLSQFWYLQQHIITKLTTTRTQLVGYMIVVCHSKIRKLVVGHFSYDYAGPHGHFYGKRQPATQLTYWSFSHSTAHMINYLPVPTYRNITLFYIITITFL